MQSNGNGGSANRISVLPTPDYSGRTASYGDEGADMSETGNFVTGRELDAKIEASEHKMAANIAKLEARIDIGFNTVNSHLEQISRNNNELSGRVSNAKWTIIALVVATGLAIVGLLFVYVSFGLQSFQAALDYFSHIGVNRE